LGALGSGEIVSTASGMKIVNLDDASVRPLPLTAPQLLRAPAGSPDGSRIAYLDNTGQAQFLDVRAGTSSPLPLPSLPTGFAWSSDGGWIAVQSVYGGNAVRLADNHVVDLGSLVVVSW